MRDLSAPQPVLPLGGAQAQGFAHIREIGPLGMIQLRAKPGTPGVSAAMEAALQCALPAPRQISRSAADPTRACAWMSPDEYLLILPHDGLAAALAAIGATLAGQHHLAVDVSDARAVFRIEGPQADQVLRKLSPANLAAMAADEVRRSRVAQIAAAFWAEEGGYTLVCFRSVAQYAFDLLRNAAQPGSEL